MKVFLWFESICVFFASFLLFMLELMVARSLAPLFGGSYQVWMICLFFFTFVLFLGYLFSTYAYRVVSYRVFFTIHLLLLVYSIFLFPFHFQEFSENSPSVSVLKNLLRTIAIPFLALSMTLPLVHYLKQRNEEGHLRFSIYAISNVGSIAGLLIYSLVLSPFFKISKIYQGWYFLFAIYALIIFTLSTRELLKSSSNQSYISLMKLFSFEAFNWKWVYATFVSTILFLSVTNFISLGIGSFPLVWMIPLVIYLLTYILNFSERRFYSQKLISFTIYIWLAIYIINYSNLIPKLLFLDALVYYLFLFLACMIVHRYLYTIRPQKNEYLRTFYLATNLGGLLGTILVAFIIPLIPFNASDALLDFVIAVIAFAILLLSRDVHKVKSFFKGPWKKKKALKIASSLLLLVFLSYGVFNDDSNEIYYNRNFYGINRVVERDDIRYLVNGRTYHGAQYVSQKIDPTPLTYYHSKSPLSEVMEDLSPKAHVAMVGLGVGSALAFSQKSQKWHIFELDADIVKIASKYFNFLDSFNVDKKIFIKDGRLGIQESSNKFDLIIFDAFSSDSIPFHLLTLEAVQTYMKKLNYGGKLLLHTSNTHLNMPSIIDPIVSDLNLVGAHKREKSTDLAGTQVSEWYIIARKSETVSLLKKKYSGWRDDLQYTDLKSWTDDWINIFRPILL